MRPTCWLHRLVFFVMIVAVGAGAAAGGTPKVKLRLGFASVAHMEHVPALLAGERLRAKGIELEPVFFAQEVLSVEAAIRGDTDMGTGASPGTLNAIQRGAPLKFFLTESRNPWTLAAKKEVARCEDLAGKRLALHSQGGISSALTQNWLKQRCPGATPAVLIIPGSERRAAALLANQIDLTPLELPDAIHVDRAQPGQFHLLADFSKELPWLLGSIFYATPRTLSTRRDVLKAYTRELIQINRVAARDPDLIATVAPKYLYKVQDQSLLPFLAKAHVEANVWPTDGGFTPQTVGRTMQFLVEAGAIKPGLKAETVGDYSLIAEVLAELGK
jgi:NitT/TauT family transport system substrate-binding protein